MSVRLHLDVPAWRAHLRTRAEQVPGIVPVAKGNGYGFGLTALAAEAATTLDADTLAVGTAREVAAVRDPGVAVSGDDFAGWQRDLVVLTPWSATDPLASELLADPHVITTVSHLDDVARVAAAAQERGNPSARVLLEVQTSMRRHGMGVEQLPAAVTSLGELTFEGWSIHLPLAGSTTDEARVLSQAALDTRPGPVWLSHLSDADYAALRSEGVDTRMRVGTSLWLGSPQSRRTTATVLDVHPVAAGERVGYWQRRIPRAGSIVVVSGGTANGVAMSAPTSASSWRQRFTAAATGSLEVAGFALSPYTIGGRKRFFVEPPHMQASMLFVPGPSLVQIGDEVPVELRLTTATVDEIAAR